MAHPIGFPLANCILQRPPGMTAEECGSLEVYRDGRQCISRWQLTDAELEELKRNGGKLYVWILIDPQPPVALSPFEPRATPDQEKKAP
ncbi:MAG: hypothetical protein M5U26_08295 [Planctomycetota bacterium]|nr:hypothetical protein [Planctomycetota bacterium]